MKKVDVFVKGPGSGRETAIRSLQSGRPRGRIDQRRDAPGAQRRPPAEAPPRLARSSAARVDPSDAARSPHAAELHNSTNRRPSHPLIFRECHMAGTLAERNHHVLIAQRPTLSEESISEFRSRFVIEPLEPGFGYTLGNSLRRTLLSSIPGAAVTSIRIDGIQHEFDDHPRCQRRRRRDRPQHQEPRRLERARRADHGLPAQAGRRPGHGRRHLGSGRCRDPQPGARHRDAERQGEVRARADHRARPRLRLGDAEPQRVQRGRSDPDRLDLLARAEGHLPRRGDPCR